MCNAGRLILVLITAAGLGACSQPANDNNVAIDINNAAPGDIEAVPADESSATPSDELANGAGNADADDSGNATDNSY